MNFPLVELKLSLSCWFDFLLMDPAELLYIDDLGNILDEGCFLSMPMLTMAALRRHVAEKLMIISEECLEVVLDDSDEGGSILGYRSNMAVDSPVPHPRLSSENRGIVGEPKSYDSQTEDDGWTVVSPHGSRCRRN
ncbi:hypothetical protein LINPERHAP2_LOCUS11135 [Linum perenne]